MTTGRVNEAREIQRYLREQRDHMIEVLIDLVSLESPSTDPASQGPVMHRLRLPFEELGLEVTEHPGETTGGHLIARQPGNDAPPQLMLGHCDTVWPHDTLDEMPPEIRDGRLHGPGVYDMKAGLVQMVFALQAIAAVGLELEVPPAIFVNSDEEIGSPESKPHIAAIAPECDRVFVLEPSLGPHGRLKTARKGVARYEVHVIGRAAHAGLDPDAGASAILELAHVVQELFKLNDPEHGVTVNVGTIAGGTRPNVIAAEAIASVDVRALHADGAAKFDAAIRQLKSTTPGTRLVVEGGINRPPMERTPGNRVLWDRAVAASAELDLEIDQAVAGGGSDGNLTSVFTATLDGLGAVGDGAHAANEHVVIDHLPERTALLARLLLDPPMR